MTIGNWRLIFLNGLDNSMIANPWFTPKYWKARQHLSELKAKKAPNAYDWNGGLGKKQTIWFQFQVQLAQDENQNIAVFCHQPLFPGNAHSLWNNDQVLQELSLFPGEVCPEMVYQASPEYPRQAKRHGVTGVVWVKALVDTSGSVLDVLIHKSSGSKLLDQAAVKNARTCRYQPGIQDGRPVNCWVSYKVEFMLDG